MPKREQNDPALPAPGVNASIGKTRLQWDLKATVALFFLVFHELRVKLNMPDLGKSVRRVN